MELFEDGGTKVTPNSDSHIEVCRTVRKKDFEQWYLAVVAGKQPSGPET